jgi:hypothetical protein
MKRAKDLLTQVTMELVEGEESLREAKKRLKKAKSPLEKENKKLVLKTIRKGVQSLGQHRALLKTMVRE